MSEHTPMPWEAVKCDDGVWMVCTKGDTVCFTDPNHKDPDGEANAKLIVRAVNSHSELIEALEGLLESDTNMLAWATSVRIARAALAKAKGETT